MGFAVGGGLVLAAGINYLGSQRSSAAAGDAARAQAAAAAGTRADIVNYSNTYTAEAARRAEATPEELRALGVSYDTSMQALNRDQKLLSAIDPSLMEASQQVLKLLRGGTADSNNPLMAQRTDQRQKLVDSLRSQYGPGAESTSIGQRALQQFDMQSNSMFQTNQQNSLSQLFGIATTDFGGRLQRDTAGIQQVGQGYGALAQRGLNAQMNAGATTLGALSGTSQQMIQTAGAPYVSAALSGQAQSSLGQNLGNAGLQYGIASMFRPTPAAAPPAGSFNWSQIPGTDAPGTTGYYGGGSTMMG